jgi:acyl-coenzyme A synthetase/AMP-(fatty) acid ligase
MRLTQVNSHPAVANAAAFPVRSPLAEDEVMAAVILQPGQQLTEAELIAFCSPTLFRSPTISRIRARAADHRERARRYRDDVGPRGLP